MGMAAQYYFDEIKGEEFENYLKSLFENLNYRVELTPRTGDYGADLIVSKGNEKIVVQAKRYNSQVGVSAVQEIIGAIHYYKASSGMVVTNNYFTSNAIKLADSADIELWDRDVLIKKAINSLGTNGSAEIPLRKTISLSDCVDFLFENSKELSDMAFILGITPRGSKVFGSPENLNHIIISGNADSGKTYLLHSIICMLFKNKDLKFILIENEKMEFDIYNGIDSLLIPVVSGADGALNALNRANKEISARFQLFSKFHVKNLDCYNDIHNNPIPRILIIIDEISGIHNIQKEVFDLINRIALNGRQAGVNLIISTQDISVLDRIKHMFPTKINCTSIMVNNKNFTLNRVDSDLSDEIHAPVTSFNEILNLISRKKNTQYNTRSQNMVNKITGVTKIAKTENSVTFIQQ